MKKMLSLLVLATSLAFAGLTVEGDPFSQYPTNYTPVFKLINKNGKEVRGFKIYSYIRFYKDFEFSTNANPVHISKTDLPSGVSTRIERMSGRAYRVVLDYSKAVIPANGTFPTNGKNMTFAVEPFYKSTSIIEGASDSKLDDFGMFDQKGLLKNFVVESASGTVLYGSHPKFNKMVGVLKKNDQSPCDYETVIDLDVEDEHNSSGVISGNKNPAGIKKDGGHVKFTYCTVEFTSSNRATFDYVVLKMDKECPENTYPFRRHHDTEDDENANSFTGIIWPSMVKDNADLEYCFVPAKSNGAKYPFSKHYGVFANPDKSNANIYHSAFKVDDEDSDNANSWYWYGKDDKSFQKKVKNIIEAGDNTIYHAIQWNGGSLKKNLGVMVAEDLENSEVRNVVVKPSAAVIKGLSRSEIGIELSSPGNVEISIVNTKGVVVAKIAKDWLLPGAQHIKWNSENVPNGRYVVTIKQNGIFSGKSFVLK